MSEVHKPAFTMRTLFLIFLLPLTTAGLFGCIEEPIEAIDEIDQEYNYVFTFSEPGVAAWKAGFADYPVGEDSFYELYAGYDTVPAEAGEEKPAFQISGNNHSDDLFMFLYRKLEGLEPSTSYDLKFKVEFASNAPRNSVGVGGSPGSSVYLKAGAIAQEPKIVQEEVGGTNFWTTSFDKGNQSQGGSDMIVLGNVGTDEEDFRYTLVERTHSTPFIVTTNENGELWVIVGTDSGFEATTTLYYTAVKVQTIKK